jgi:hypothetical protein
VFSDSDRRNIIVGSVVTLLLVVACVGSMALYRQAVPEQVERDTVNITEASYQSAVDKWVASNLSSYEMTVERGDYAVTLDVSDNGNTTRMVKHFYRGTESRTDDPPEALVHMTVEKLFAQTHDALSKVTTGGLRSFVAGDTSTFYDFEVQFDPTLGYPTRITEYRRLTWVRKDITWRFLEQPDTTVRDFKVLK